MCLKNKIVSIALGAVIALAGIFVIGNNIAQAENLTTASTAGLSIEQLQQLVLKLQEQIIYIIQLLSQQKPVCGNGVCETAKGETAASCPADCGTSGCAKEGDTFTGDTRACCAGLEKVLSNIQPACSVGNSTASTCSGAPNYTCRRIETPVTTPICSQNCKSAGFSGSYCNEYSNGQVKCSKGGYYLGVTNDCNGKDMVDGARACCCANNLTFPVCGNGTCETGESKSNCPKDCGAIACVKEGGSTYTSNGCCSGLAAIDNARLGSDGSCIANDNSLKYCARCGNGICGAGENECNCPADCKIADKGKAKCIATGGGWNYSDCASGCVFNTKSERLGSEGMACTAVCLKDYKCDCPSGKFWASREEGCLTKLCAGENEAITSSKPECCTGLERKYAYYDDCAAGQDCIGIPGRTICVKPTSNCAKEGETFTDSNRTCCTGLTRKFVPSYINCTNSTNCVGSNGYYTCTKSSDCTAEGRVKEMNGPACCSGLTSVLNCGDGNTLGCPNNGSSRCTRCGNGICGLGENSLNCPKDCSQDNKKCSSDSDCTAVCSECYSRTWAMRVDMACAESPSYYQTACKCVSGTCQKTTTTCAETCRAKGYSGSRCQTWAVTQYSTPGSCGAYETNVGWTSDCTVASDQGGGGRTCCCNNIPTPVVGCASNLPYGTCIENGGMWTCNNSAGTCYCGCPATCSSSAGCGGGSTVTIGS